MSDLTRRAALPQPFAKKIATEPFQKFCEESLQV